MKEVSAALVRAQKTFAPALKDSTNPHFKSKYADLSACVSAVLGSLNDNGIALLQRSHPSENGVSIETIFVHESGEQLSGGVLHVPAAKHDPQGYGSAITYARRYALMAACGIAPEDDDGNAGVSARVAANKAEHDKAKAEIEEAAKCGNAALKAAVDRLRDKHGIEAYLSTDGARLKKTAREVVIEDRAIK